MRVVITTANFIEKDFHYLTQGAYVQDFPLLSSTCMHYIVLLHILALFVTACRTHLKCYLASGACRSDFYRDIDLYLSHIHPHQQDARFKLKQSTHICSFDVKCNMCSVKEALTKYDFSSAQVVIIPSVPGRHVGMAINQFGHSKLRAVLSRRTGHIPMDAHDKVVMQYSSWGGMGELRRRKM